MKIKPKLIIMAGNIGTGKSTLTKKYVEQGYVVASKDMLRYTIGNGKYEDIIWGTDLSMVYNFMKLKVNIVVDGCAITKDIRESYIRYGQLFNYEIIAVELPKLSK